MPEAKDAETGSPSFEVDSDGIGWITFDDPSRPVNVLTERVMRRLGAALDEARAAGREGRARVIVLRSGKESSFIAGADVSAIEGLEDPTEAEIKIKMGQAVYMDVETLPVPTVAAIHGPCLGGGVELALACTHRVVSDSPKTKVGLPEVMLGILPAWGGTTRLPRLVGLQAALDLLLTGGQIDARKAQRIGFAGSVFPADLFEEQVHEFARKAPDLPSGASRRKRPLATRALDETRLGRRLVLRLARKRVLKNTGGHYPAPLRILDVLTDSLGRSVEHSLAAEARAAAELVVSPVCKNLIHVFHMREAARKGTGVQDSAVSPAEIHTLGVLGAGVMGGGIGQLAAYNGVRVFLKDIRHDAVASGLQHASSLFDKAVERRKISQREASQRMEMLTGGLEYHGIRGADLVVEAVVERADIKRAVLAETEAHVAEDCVIATNTSSLSVDELAQALERPERFCGMHFFNPVHRMPLVEVVRGAGTSSQTVATVYRLALTLGKVPVVVGDGAGFLVNRILGPYLNEAGYLLGDGASIDEIDRVAKRFGLPMGPLRLIDEIGIDVSRHAGSSLHEALGDRMTPSPVLVALGETDRLGRKGGRGFYLYEKGVKKGVDETVYEAVGLAGPSESQPVSERNIRSRLLGQMINEAARILEDGIVTRASDVDLAMIMGTGFPPFRGGLLKFADTIHPKALLDRLRELERDCGVRFSAAPLLRDLAAADRGFYDSFPDTGA